jgi:multidrug efflux pump subunit AcrB
MLAASAGLVVNRQVVLKMLPFDNKSEFQVLLDLPSGTAVERTAAVLDDLAAVVARVPEVTDFQIYAGTASPINFNGLVRQYDLRQSPELGDIQVNLVAKGARERKSYEIALALRTDLDAVARVHGADVKVVEVPPGPPVLAPLVAEIYGLEYEGQQRVAGEIRQVFEATAGVVDVDDSGDPLGTKLVARFDRTKAALFGVSQRDAVTTISAAMAGEDVTYLHRDADKFPIPVRLELHPGDKVDMAHVLSLRVRGADDALVPLSAFVELREAPREHAIYHKDLLPVSFVTGDVAGETDSPLHGMFAIFEALAGRTVDGGQALDQRLLTPPDDPYTYSVKWDGEWQITYETFRDMGLAYAVGLVLIYLLVVAQFRSYVVPLIIMAPIPLTVIGVMPGHAILGVQFTATSMIGMIALAGIIVRNSILLVDFIEQQLAEGLPLEDAVLRSVAVRAKPIALTALAAMLGATFILDDPIFSGLAVSLIAGILVSTILTLIVIPVLYYAWRRPTP